MGDLLIGVYPGTFDPITSGHNDIIFRAAKILDKLVVGVAINIGKEPLFSLEERLKMVKAEATAMKNVSNKIEVCGFDNLLVDFAAMHKAKVIIRGLRAVSDFDYEFQMSSMNAKLGPDVETICLMASDKHQFIASRLVKEIALLKGNVSQFVSPRVEKLLKARVDEK